MIAVVKNSPAKKNGPKVLSRKEYGEKIFRSTQYEKDMMKRVDSANDILKEISQVSAKINVHRSMLMKGGRALYDLVAEVERNGITSHKTIAKGLTTNEVELVAMTYVDTVKVVVNDFSIGNNTGKH